jgi:hypothetical protein
MAAIVFCRDGGAARIEGVRSALVEFDRGHAWVRITGMEVTIPALDALGLRGCVRVHGKCDAFFMNVRMRSVLASLGEAFDIVLRAGQQEQAQRELEFVAALIEWGCGPLPTLGELRAYERGVADAEHSIESRLRAESARAAAWSVEHVARLRGEIENLRATVERQRAELLARPVDNRAFERAERQRAADLAVVHGLRDSWTAAHEAAPDSCENEHRHRVALANRIEAARLIAIELREREVVQ